MAPDYSKKFVVMIDFSLVAAGGVLWQVDSHQLQPIVFIGRKFSQAESCLAACERECLGILMLLEKLKYFLLGREFTIFTNAKALVYLRTAPSTNSKLMRWSLRLAEFNFNIQHVAGKLFLVPTF